MVLCLLKGYWYVFCLHVVAAHLTPALAKVVIGQAPPYAHLYKPLLSICYSRNSYYKYAFTWTSSEQQRQLAPSMLPSISLWIGSNLSSFQSSIWTMSSPTDSSLHCAHF
jgi:hypothetical protein